MYNVDLDLMPHKQSIDVLLAYCEELSRINQEQGKAIQKEDFEKLHETIEDFNRLRENIDTEFVLLQSYDKDGQESKDAQKTIKALLRKVVQENQENIRMMKGLMSQVKVEMKKNNQIGKYLKKAGVRQANIIDKSI